MDWVVEGFSKKKSSSMSSRAPAEYATVTPIRHPLMDTPRECLRAGPIGWVDIASIWEGIKFRILTQQSDNAQTTYLFGICSIQNVMLAINIVVTEKISDSIFSISN